MLQFLCVVDENGRFLREEERDICHQGDGLLHSAFLVVIFNENKELMLARRSAQKKLWPGFWDGTVASHYYKDKDANGTIMARLYDEIGIAKVHSEFLFTFRYQERYQDIGSENEICDVFKVSGINAKNLAIAETEISAYKFVNIEKIKEDMINSENEFTPWFRIVFQRLLDNDLLDII